VRLSGVRSWKHKSVPWALSRGEGRKKPERAAKYRGPHGELWTGVGAMAGWLKKLKDAGED
jgi:hypothetical protein